MRLELIEVKGSPHLYEKTELHMSGTATYDNGSHERFRAHAFVGMYGTVHVRLDVEHPVSLSETTVAVTLNKQAFDRQGIEHNDMDAVMPLLVDHASRKNNYGVLVSKCTGVEFDA